jgi:hypothetical protein
MSTRTEETPVSTETTAPVTTAVTQIRRDSLTSLHGRPQWVTVHVATPAEIDAAALMPSAGIETMFWLDGSDQPYFALSARRVSDRLARIARLTDEQLAESPRVFDAVLAARYGDWEQASTARDRAWEQIHTAAGDRRDYRGRSSRAWGRTHSEVEQTVRQMAAHNVPLPALMGSRQAPGDLLVALRDAEAALSRAMLAVQEMEVIYRRAPWTRYFPCENRDGHIHSSYRDCPTVRWDTAMAWRPDLSGLTVEHAVQMPPVGLGPALCTVCFPAAPVEYKSSTLGQVADELTRAEREAARAARQAVKDAKQLTEDEQFRTEGRYGETVTTVARCKEIIRQAIDEEVQLEYYSRPGAEQEWQGDSESFARVRGNVADRLAQLQRDAGRAAAVLTAREAAHEGWGATQAAITKMQQNKYKSARKEWGL